MEDFVYDEMVTAQSLNNIAIDLGKGDFSVFSDNTPYAVDKLNEITKALVGKGISSALNKFEITVSAESVVVGTGIAFFESGKKLKIEMPVTLPFKAGELYLYENISTGVVNINIGELPTDNYIHLATINEDLTFVDKRTIAKANVVLPTEGNSYSFTDTIEFRKNEEISKSKNFSIPIEGVSKIVIKSVDDFYGLTSLYIYDVNEEVFEGFAQKNVSVQSEGNDLIREAKGATLYNYAGSAQRSVGLGIVGQSDTAVRFKYSMYQNKYMTDNAKINVEYTVFGGIEK